MMSFAMSRLVGRRLKVARKCFILSAATTAKGAIPITFARYYQPEHAEQPFGMGIDEGVGEGRIHHPQHITAAQLYRICRRGRFSDGPPANFDGDSARFQIDPGEFYAARSRLQMLSDST